MNCYALGSGLPGSSIASFSLGVPGRLFWIYFAGFAVAVAGLVSMARATPPFGRGPDRISLFGPLLFAVPMAVFGAQHFTDSKFVATVVPSWMPWHLFWTYLVGAALIAAAFAIATEVQASVAALMLSIMLFLFVCMIHVPACFRTSFQPTRVTLALRDLALSGGALALAASCGVRWPEKWSRVAVGLARCMVSVGILFFGIQQFLHPEAAPGIPQENPVWYVSLPSWVPVHALWAYITGAAFLLCGLAMLANRRARPAATVLGQFLLVLTALLYLPRVLAQPGDIGKGLNYLAIHSALAGAVLLLASALPEHALEGFLPRQKATAGLGHVAES